MKNNYKNTIYKNKHYTHFDSRIKFEKKTLPLEYKNKIENKNWIVKHGFYPFVQYEQRNYKYPFCKEHKDYKSRTIMYCSHIDRFIYQYYASKLNKDYNSKARKLGIDEAAIAYRTNLNKNNIDFAKEVFDFITKNDNCIIYVTDFNKYFDYIDHYTLKKKIEYILGIDKLPDDYYKVFKSITKYCFAKYDDIFNYYKKINSNATLKNFKKADRFFKVSDFKKFKKGKYLPGIFRVTPKATLKNIKKASDFKQFKKQLVISKEKYILKNKNSYGIPQGSPISAILSNIYLIDFDKNLNDFTLTKKGLYKRYCDDIVIVIPIVQSPEITLEEIKTIINLHESKIPHLSRSPEKTKNFIYKNNSIDQISDFGEIEKESTFIDYLGFTFNGKVVKIREKSITNYYRKLHKRIRIINRYSKRYDRYVYRKKFYKKYSHLGATKKQRGLKYGNFITYAYRSHDIFKEKSIIKKQVKNHWSIIQKNLVKFND